MSEPVSKTTKCTGRVKHGEGLNDYLMLGADRSLEKLCRQYAETMLRPPALVTLKLWSAKHSWQAKAAQHDARVASQVAEKAEEAAVEQGLDHVQALTAVADKALRKVIDGLEGESIQADDAYKLAALVNSALGAIKGVQLLTGGPTERIGVGGLPKDCIPEWMAEKLARMAAEKTNEAMDAIATANDETEPAKNVTRH